MRSVGALFAIGVLALVVLLSAAAYGFARRDQPASPAERFLGALGSITLV